MGKLLFALAALLLVSAVASAQPIPIPNTCDASSITNYWNNRFGNWQDICAIGILICLMLISVLYMLSQVFGKPGLSAWCKKELFQLMVTGIILAGVFAFINFSCVAIKPSLFVSLEVGQPDDLYQYAASYLEWLRDAMYTVYSFASILNGFFSWLVEVYVRQSPGGFGINLRPLGGLAPLSNILSIAMNATLIGGVFTTIAQLRLLRVIQVMAFNIILPIGLICRCFEPFRRFGGSMIAIAIGLYLFYPFLLMLNAGIVKNTLLVDGPTGNIMDVYTRLSEVDYTVQTSPDKIIDRLAAGTDPNYYAEPTLAFPKPGEGLLDWNWFLYLFDKVWQIVTKGLIAGLFLPLFNFVLLITFIRNLSKMLGEEVDVTNITRMI